MWFGGRRGNDRVESFGIQYEGDHWKFLRYPETEGDAAPAIDAQSGGGTHRWSIRYERGRFRVTVNDRPIFEREAPLTGGELGFRLWRGPDVVLSGLTVRRIAIPAPAQPSPAAP